jgi:iron(III) transport system permease protein
VRSRHLDSRLLILPGAALLVGYLTVVPLGMLVYGSLRSGAVGEPGATYTLANYARAYLDPALYRLFLNSVAYASGTCLVSFLIGAYLAWVTERTNAPFRGFIAVVALVPFIIPGILNTISWLLLLSPRIGLINLVVRDAFGLTSGPFNVYSLGGMIWVEATHLYPLVFLLMAAAFRSMDMSLEEASIIAGSRTFTTLRRVTLPLMRPAVMSTMLIMFVRAIESFEVPALVGIPAGTPVFTSKIFLAIHQFPSDFGLAGAYAITLLLLSTTGVVIYRRITRRSERFATITGRGYRPRVIDLGRWRYLAAAGALVIFAATVVLPVFVLLWVSVTPYYSVPSWELLQRSTLEAYRYVLNYPMAVRAFLNSFYLAAASATAVMLLTSVVAWITVKSRIPGRALLDNLAFIPIAFPGIVLGVSLIWVSLALMPAIYGTFWLLLIAYITRFMPYGIRTASASMIQINDELEEAALACGSSWRQAFQRIILPLLMPGFVAGWIYVSIVSLRELSTSILLYSPPSIVLSILAFDMWEGGQYNYVAALGVMMVLLLVLMAVVARRVGARIGLGP